MEPSITDWVQAGAALLTMIAAIAALTIAAKAPRLAAKFAEQYRRQNAAEEERQRFRLNVFMALMKHRSEILAADARAAINLVDVAFADDLQVRNARRLFIEATTAEPYNATTIVERFHALIEAVTRAMDMGSLTGFDVRSGYTPSYIVKLDEAAIVEAEEKIARREAGRNG
jgi:hypothetical protein